MASIKYSTSSAVGSYNQDILFPLSIYIEDVSHDGYGGATLYITVYGHRGDYDKDGFSNVYFDKSSNLLYFNEDTDYIQPKTDQFITDFYVNVSCDGDGKATFSSGTYFCIYGTTGSGKRGIKVTLNSASGLEPWYYVIYYNPDGTSYSSDTFYSGKSKTILSSGPSKSSTSAGTSNFTITGDGNGGYFGSKTILTDTITATKNGTYNYSFASWNTNSNGSGTTYTPGKSVTMPKNVLYLYPVYNVTTSYTYSNNATSALKTPTKDDTQPAELQYTVIYDANGGSVSTTSQKVKTTRSWSYGGWASSSDSSSADAKATYENTVTIYAYWTYKDTKGKATLPTPTRVGYKFLGWGTSSSQTSGLLSAGATPEISSNITYFAIWKADGSVRLYYNGTDKYKIALIWMYYPTSTSDPKPWKLVIPYMKTDANWKITAG